jgi:hypothetical protein
VELNGNSYCIASLDPHLKPDSMHTEKADLRTTSFHRSQPGFPSSRKARECDPEQIQTDNNLVNHESTKKLQRAKKKVNPQEYTDHDDLCLKLSKTISLKAITIPWWEVYMSKLINAYTAFPVDHEVAKQVKSIMDHEPFENPATIVKINHISHVVDESTQKYIERKCYLSRMASLVSWLLIIHTGTQMKFFPHLSPEEEKYSNTALVDWLLSKTSSSHSTIPTDQRLPERHNAMRESALNEVAIIITEYLSKEPVQEKSISTSSKLLLIWYQEHKSHILQPLDQKSYEEYLGFLIKNATLQARKMKEKFENLVGSPVPMKFGCFQPSREIKLPAHMMPEKYVDHIKGIDMEGIPLLERIKKFHKTEIRAWKILFHFDDIPVYLVVDKNNPKSGWLRISWRMQKRTQPQKVTQKLNSLIGSLIQCHTSLKKVAHIQEGDNKILFLEETQKEFIDWIEKILFTPDEGMPLLGKINKINRPLNRTQFGDIQIAVIYYLSYPRSYKMLPKMSMGFIGTWLKTHYPSEWIHLFGDDNSFVEFMENLFLTNGDQFEQFRLKRNNLVIS